MSVYRYFKEMERKTKGKYAT